MTSLPTCILVLWLICLGYSTQNDVEEALAVISNDVPKGSAFRNRLNTSDQDANAIRIEFIKARILRKLKMFETPQIDKGIGKLPIPLTLSVNRALPPANKIVKEDDIFATVNQVTLLATQAPIGNEAHRFPSNTFSFTLPPDLNAEEVNSTVLWVHKEHDIMDGPKYLQKFQYFQVQGGHEVLLRQHSSNISEGWIQLDFSQELRNWLLQKNLTPTIRVSCVTCGYTKNYQPISVQSHEPLLLINFQNNIKKKRPRRNLNCTPGATECCREELFVNFQDIGWDSWVLEPRGYHAYFCKGSCHGAAAATLSYSVHNTILRKLNDSKKRLGPMPCCAATEHSPITIIYRSDNRTVTRTTLSNMVVESCGCL